MYYARSLVRRNAHVNRSDYGHTAFMADKWFTPLQP
ncbi:hypothetical protein JOF56_010992 [Kibdelosporangium banguiense]|uniref:Uncharacterized protein n=1 Tax=Kibdelosporangium banguiense TaxID=1365924 RepID=A0ABS4U1U5_9PSEU|nr:hypothetical protein [Kibdelosporangium banguiense]